MTSTQGIVASLSLPSILRGLGYVQTQFVKSVVGEDFYTTCTTDAYVRAIIEFCVQDVRRTEALARRIKVTNLKNVENNSAQFSKHEYAVIGRRLRSIDVSLQETTSATLHELLSLDEHRSNIVTHFESGDFVALDKSLVEVHRQITSMNVKRRTKASVLEMIQFAAVKLVQWHFFLLSVDLVNSADSHVRAFTSFLEGWGLPREVTRKVLVPLVSTGLLRDKKVYGKSKFVVTELFTEHPWRSFVSIVSEAAGYMAGWSSASVMSAFVMGLVRDPAFVIMMLFLFFVGIVFHKDIMSSLRGMNVANCMSEGTRIVQRSLALSQTGLRQAYASTVARFGDKPQGIRYHTRHVRRLHNSADSLSLTSSNGSITSRFK